MKIHLLGTGTSTGVPVIGCECSVCLSGDAKNSRFRASIALEANDGEFIVIDTGPEFRLQALRAGISRLKYVIYTHAHADHTQGFDDLRAYGFYDKAPLQAYLFPEFVDEFKQRFSYAFSRGTGYTGAIPQVELNTIGEEPFQVAGLEFWPYRLPHGHVNSCAFRIGDFMYATDFKKFSEKQIMQLQGKVKIMVASGVHFDTHRSHSVIPETVELFRRLGVVRGIITHLSHLVDYKRDAVKIPHGVEYGYDGMVIDLKSFVS